MPLIVSSIPGRIRIRHKALASARRSERLQAAFLALDGVVRVDANTAASSLIVHYDAAAIPAEAMESVIDDIVAAELKALHAGRNREATVNRYAKYGMLLSLAATFALARGGRRGHALSAGLFAACLGLHLYFHRGRILS
ncbi:MAG: hypothetical protein LBF61_03870 [Azoarcus sp.]|jgi:hypothetical protein|nr:hypothetical protein [Azoarcus sp.]